MRLFLLCPSDEVRVGVVTIVWDRNRVGHEGEEGEGLHLDKELCAGKAGSAVDKESLADIDVVKDEGFVCDRVR